ncbi:hypothetical protein [Methylorubrum extorquens]|nr:hypothetical protein [Methylorubrum extorquens]
MTIRITEDEAETGGYAFVDLGRPAPSALLSFRRQDAEPRHLGAEGWQPEVAWLAPLSISERDGRAVARFGPNVVDRIEELVPIEIVAQDGTSFGVVSWPFITPAPAGYGILAAAPVAPPSLTETAARDVSPEVPVVADAENAPASALDPPTPPSAARASLPLAEVTVERRPRVWPAAAALFLGLALAAAGGAYVYRDDLRMILATRETPQPTSSNTPPPVVEQAPMTLAAPSQEAPRPSAAELRQRYTRLIEARASAPAFLDLGETALAAHQGGTAFRAFEEADPVANADAAWQLARFYDPSNLDAVARTAARPDAVRAAYYYALWRNRSPRHTDALRGLCDANTDLAGRDERLRNICRP